MASRFKEVFSLFEKLYDINTSRGKYAMKFRLLLPVLLALCGCRSDLYYQEQAVEAAREFIFKNARELTPEQFAYVRLTPPVLLTGPILARNEKNTVKNSLAGGEKRQICVAWRIPEQKQDYLVFGMSEPRMAFWRPIKLIRRRLGNIDSNAQAAMNQAQAYAMNALYRQLSAADLNFVRFTHPELIETSFELEKVAEAIAKKNAEAKEKAAQEQSGSKPAENKTAESKPAERKLAESKLAESKPAEPESAGDVPPRPWKKIELPLENIEELVQLSLLWKLQDGRYAVFCGMGKDDLSQWQILMAGIFDAAEVRKASVKKLRTPERFLFEKIQKAPQTGVKKTVHKGVSEKTGKETSAPRKNEGEK